jgi:hypothetical protein
MKYRCLKCNVKIKEDKWINLETVCMSGNCPVEDIDEENGCKLCGANIKEIIVDRLGS